MRKQKVQKKQTNTMNKFPVFTVENGEQNQLKNSKPTATYSWLVVYLTL